MIKDCYPGECDICTYRDICNVYIDMNKEKPAECDIIDIKEDEEYDEVNHPRHYTENGMECIDEMIMLYGVEETMSFCKLNAHKYRKRALSKGGKKDIEKSDWYLAKYKELIDVIAQNKCDAYNIQLNIIKQMVRDGVEFNFNIDAESVSKAIFEAFEAI